jgi:hypothetical protein
VVDEDGVGVVAALGQYEPLDGIGRTIGREVQADLSARKLRYGQRVV